MIVMNMGLYEAAGSRKQTIEEGKLSWYRQILPRKHCKYNANINCEGDKENICLWEEQSGRNEHKIQVTLNEI